MRCGCVYFFNLFKTSTVCLWGIDGYYLYDIILLHFRLRKILRTKRTVLPSCLLTSTPHWLTVKTQSPWIPPLRMPCRSSQPSFYWPSPQASLSLFITGKHQVISLNPLHKQISFSLNTRSSVFIFGKTIQCVPNSLEADEATKYAASYSDLSC